MERPGSEREYHAIGGLKKKSVMLKKKRKRDETGKVSWSHINWFTLYHEGNEARKLFGYIGAIRR